MGPAYFLPRLFSFLLVENRRTKKEPVAAAASMIGHQSYELVAWGVRVMALMDRVSPAPRRAEENVA